MVKSKPKGLVARVIHRLLWPVRFFKFVCMTIGAVVLFSAFAVSFYVWSIVHSAPHIGSQRFSDLQARAIRVVSDKREDKRKTLTWIPLGEVNRDFLYSVVTSEDAQFFEHSGFNYDALLNSLAENLRKREYAVGGSTISQQVAKNLWLQNEKSLKRKIQEYVVTKELESKFKKNEILELYLNLAEFGPDLFGVSEASQAYFGKKPSEINAAEGTFIALMLPSPRGNYYKVYQNKTLTKQARHQVNRVLRDMRFHEYITESQYRTYSRYNFFGHLSERDPAGE